MIKAADIFTPRKIRGMALLIQEDGSLLCRHLVLAEKGGILIRIGELEIVSDLKDLKNISKAEPVALTLMGKGVVQRIVLGPKMNSNQVIGQVIPGAKAEDYELEVFQNEDVYLASVCRKNLVGEMTGKIKDMGFRVLSTEVGAKNMGYAFELSEANFVNDGNHQLETNSKGENFWQKSQEGTEMIIAGEVIQPSELHPYLSAMRVLLSLDCDSKSFQSYLAEEKYRSAIKVIGVAAVAILFCGLVINLFAFQNLTAEVQRLSIENSIHDNMFQTLDSIKSEVASKHDLIARNGVSKLTRLAEISDKVGKSLPDKITLTKLEMAPRNGKHEAKKPLRFKFDNVQIEGVASNDQELNRWLEAIGEMDFVKAVRFLGYSADSKSGKFSLEIDVQ